MGRMIITPVICSKGHLLAVRYCSEECPYCNEIDRLVANGADESAAEKFINISAYLDTLTERLR